MSRMRFLAITIALPLAYLVAVCLATRPRQARYAFANPTAVTVSDNGSPAILHSPPAVYPPRALRNHVEGSVTLEVTVARDGTVTRATPVSGPELLRHAAAGNVRQWQFEARAQETQVHVQFSLRNATHSLALPEPVRRIAPRYRGSLHGSVRVVAMVDPQGRVEFVQPVTGPETLVPAAVESVRHWSFRPMRRDGQAEYGTAVVDVSFGQ